MELHNLFGGAFTCKLPSYSADMSKIRQIPDNQEVFCHEQSDQSLIIEILERVDKEDDESIKYHFKEICIANDANNVEVLEIINVLNFIDSTECDSCLILKSKENISKFNEEVKNPIFLILALFRYKKYNADVLFTFNDPMFDNGTCSNRWTEENIMETIYSLNLKNSDIFVN